MNPEIWFEVREDFLGILKKGDCVKAGSGYIQGVTTVVLADGKVVPSRALMEIPGPPPWTTATWPTASNNPSVSMVDTERATLASILSDPNSNFNNLDEVGVSVVSVLDIPPEPEKAPIILGEHQILFSSLTNGVLTSSGIDHIIDIFPEDYFPDDVRCDIPERNPNWYWNPEVLETIVLGYQEDETTLLIGPPGTGKSDGVREFAAIIRQPFMRIGCRGDMESSSILGYPWAVGGGTMEFKKGLLPQGLEDGYMICVDEVMKMTPTIAMSCQELYERNSRRLVLDEMPGSKKERTIQATKDVRLMFTDNVCGTGDNFQKFGATQIQDSSSLDRFAFTQTVTYIPEQEERKLLKDMFPEVKDGVISDIVKLANLVRKGYENDQLSCTMSMRGLSAMCRLITKGFSTSDAVNKCYRHKLGTDQEIQQLDAALQTVGIK